LECCIVIPAKDEQESLPQVLRELLSLGVPRERIVVVDSHSSDATPLIAKSFGVEVLSQKVGKGKTGAVLTALRELQCKCVVLMDADGQHPPPVALEIGELLDVCDHVLSMRKTSSKDIYSLGNKVLTLIFNALFGTRFKDVLSGLIGIKLPFETEEPPRPCTYPEPFLLWNALRRGARICTIEYTPRSREGGKKKVSIVTGLDLLACILALKIRSVTQRLKLG